MHGLTPLWMLNSLGKTGRFFEKGELSGISFMIERKMSIR
jgi:hypothetical protein